ncbi:MAG: NAD(P)-dependent oxidoreductase [Proteobacteria bacterium]|nr:NAD(P)-dependent oxidoreductase [Pseudomonadota bacterium]
MRILVTGSNGFLGRELVHKLQRHNHTVIGLDKDFESHSDQFIHHDLSEPLRISGATFDVCIHLASYVGGFLHNASTKGLENYELTLLKNVARFSRASHCSRFLYASTINVFEKNSLFCETPLPKLDQQTPYARAKALGERFVEESFSHFGIVRMTNLFGRSQAEKLKGRGTSHVIPELLRQISESTELEVLGDGNQERNFLHVSDAAVFYRLILKSPQRGWFNLRSDLQLSIKDLSKELMKWKQKELPIRFRPEYLRYEPNPIHLFNCTATNALGWKPQVSSILEGLERTSPFVS